MKALSVRQPWAWLIVNGFKDVENRSWNTSFRGTILVHASKGMTKDEYFDCVDLCKEIAKNTPFPKNTIMPSYNDMFRGGIVGTVDIMDCLDKSDSPWYMGEKAFVLENAEKFDTPKPCKGALGFFTPDYNSRYVEPKKLKKRAKPALPLFT